MGLLKEDAPFATRIPPESESRVTEETLSAVEHRSARPASAGAIPVIDVEGSEPRFLPTTYGDYFDWWYTESYPPERQDDD